MELGEVGPSLARAETLVMNVSCNVSGQHIKLELDKKKSVEFLYTHNGQSKTKLRKQSNKTITNNCW